MAYDIILSGRITGNTNYRRDFALAVVQIHRKDPNLVIWNPAELEGGRDYRWYMRKCIHAIMDEAAPDCVHVRMPGWNRSLGSVAEWALCRCLGMKCLHLSDF